MKIYKNRKTFTDARSTDSWNCRSKVILMWWEIYGYANADCQVSTDSTPSGSKLQSSDCFLKKSSDFTSSAIPHDATPACIRNKASSDSDSYPSKFREMCEHSASSMWSDQKPTRLPPHTRTVSARWEKRSPRRRACGLLPADHAIGKQSQL